jgi:hypothetical protein
MRHPIAIGLAVLLLLTTAAGHALASRSGDAPVAIPDGYLATAGQTLVVMPANGLLANDFDPEGDPITVASYWLAEHGQLTVSTSGHFSYTPAPGYTGPDAFQYRISDGTSISDVATVTLTVLPPANRAPFAVDDHYLLPAGEVLDVAHDEGLLRNDFDFEGDPLQVLSYQSPANGTLDLTGIGSFTYTPDPGFVGSEILTYTISDGQNTSTGELGIHVIEARNRGPVAQTDWYYTPTGTALVVDAALGLLRNDLDPDGDWFSVTSVSSPDHGTIDPTAIGSFTYTPDPDFTGVEVMQYNLIDNQGNPSTQPGELRILVGVYGDIASGVLTPPSPDGFTLHAPMPNPFNPRTEIAYRTAAAGHVELRILDLHGRLVATLLDENRPAGDHVIPWNGTDDRGGRVASGVYMAELRCGPDRAVQKVTLLK